MGDDISIKVENVSKTFILPHEKSNSIKSIVIHFYRRNKGFEKQRALKGVSFEVKKGEFFGVVGKNGSGKSTLLKLLAGIYSPDTGSIQTRGKLTPFIELGVGFSPELSGRDNVYLNGALLGFSRKEMTSMYKDIVEFAELERFMDQKLKNYSSGMQVRLAFSIAIRAQSDILVLDEVLAVGDLDFQQKCFDYFSKIKKGDQTVILVTHDMGSVLKFCDRAMLVNNGKVLKIGNPKEIADAYIEKNFESKNEDGDTHTPNTKNPYVKKVEIKQNDKPKNTFNGGEKCEVMLDFVNPKDEFIHFGVQIFTNEGVYCFGTNSKISGAEPTKKASGLVSLTLELDLVPGRYTITVATMNEDATSVYDYRPNAASFTIKQTNQLEGVAKLKQEWKL